MEARPSLAYLPELAVVREVGQAKLACPSPPWSYAWLGAVWQSPPEGFATGSPNDIQGPPAAFPEAGPSFSLFSASTFHLTSYAEG